MRLDTITFGAVETPEAQRADLCRKQEAPGVRTDGGKRARKNRIPVQKWFSKYGFHMEGPHLHAGITIP